MTLGHGNREGKRKRDKRKYSDTEFRAPSHSDPELRCLHEGMTRNFDIREVTVGAKHANNGVDREKEGESHHILSSGHLGKV